MRLLKNLRRKFNMKKKIIIILCIIISFISALSDNQNIFLSDSKNLIEILLKFYSDLFDHILRKITYVNGIRSELHVSNNASLGCASLRKRVLAMQTLTFVSHSVIYYSESESSSSSLEKSDMFDSAFITNSSSCFSDKYWFFLDIINIS